MLYLSVNLTINIDNSGIEVKLIVKKKKQFNLINVGDPFEL